MRVMQISVLTAAFFWIGPVSALSGADTLGEWRRATVAEKVSLVRDIVGRINGAEVSAAELMACIDETAGDGGLDRQEIARIAAICVVMLREG